MFRSKKKSDFFSQNFFLNFFCLFYMHEGWWYVRSSGKAAATMIAVHSSILFEFRWDFKFENIVLHWNLVIFHLDEVTKCLNSTWNLFLFFFFFLLDCMSLIFKCYMYFTWANVYVSWNYFLFIPFLSKLHLCSRPCIHVNLN